MLTLPQIEGQEFRRGVLELSDDDWCRWLEQHGQPPLRRRQIRRWLLAGGAQTFADMTDLPRQLRQELEREWALFCTSVAQHWQAADGTHKLLVQLADGGLTECVLLQEQNRRTACISPQVGCGMACAFCASGLGGLQRNLTAVEIIEQLIRLRNLPAAQPQGGSPADGLQRLTHVVVMGMGEPLANLEALLAALAVAMAKDGLGLSARHITISTVGLPERMRQLAELGKPFNLAVSLHAPTDDLRSRLVPANAKIGLAEILRAADDYFAHTGRQVTYEYVLLRDVNDGQGQARALGRLLQGRCAHVNLIPFNEVAGLPFRRPSQEALASFVATLRQQGLSVKVRKRKGAEIEAACGQLRRRINFSDAVQKRSAVPPPSLP